MATRHMVTRALVVLALVVVGCLTIYGQQTGSGQAAVPQAGDVVGVYVGSYTCGQGNTRLRLEIRSDDGRLLTAIFTFYLPAGSANPTSRHSFRLQGTVNANGETQLTPRAWETPPPPGWLMVGMTGRFDPSAGTFTGRINGPGCTTFSAARDTSQPLTTGGTGNSGGRPTTPVAQSAAPTRAGATQTTSAPQTQSPSAPQAQSASASQNAATSQEAGSNPETEARANCESDVVLMNFYDCVCYARRTAEVLSQSGVVRPPAYVPDGPPTTVRANNPKVVEHVAAMGRYNEELGKAREAATKTTTCISNNRISQWAHKQVSALVNRPGRPQISGDCVAEAVTRQYHRNPNPNSVYVNGLLVESAAACQR
jgi:hypothetical protein